MLLGRLDAGSAVASIVRGLVCTQIELYLASYAGCCCDSLQHTSIFEIFFVVV